MVALSFNTDKHFGASSYSVPADEHTIMNELLVNGPLEAAFAVYEGPLTCFFAHTHRLQQ
ncbi:MAG TPA: hypothetical protein V6C97_01025 [Oculatellaceae cyanobacterium]